MITLRYNGKEIYSMSYPDHLPRLRTTVTFEDRCLGCRRIFTSEWSNRTGYCSSSCILAMMTIREGEYVSPCWRGNRVRWVIATRENPNPAAIDTVDAWLAFTDTPEDLIRPQLGIFAGAGQFAGSGESEVDAVLDLIAEIEAAS